MANARVPKTDVFPSTDAETQRLELQGSKLYGGASFLDTFLARNPREVLDVGCGYFTRHVAKALPSSIVTGLDIDEHQIAYARSHRSNNDIRFELGDMASMPFANDSFDLVLCRFALVHNQNPTATTGWRPLGTLAMGPAWCSRRRR